MYVCMYVFTSFVQVMYVHAHTHTCIHKYNLTVQAFVEVQERMVALNMSMHKYIATVFQKYALRIHELEDAFVLISSVFRYIKA
jgi:hypothetical protein